MSTLLYDTISILFLSTVTANNNGSDYLMTRKEYNNGQNGGSSRPSLILTQVASPATFQIYAGSLSKHALMPRRLLIHVMLYVSKSAVIKLQALILRRFPARKFYNLVFFMSSVAVFSLVAQRMTSGGRSSS